MGSTYDAHKSEQIERLTKNMAVLIAALYSIVDMSMEKGVITSHYGKIARRALWEANEWHEWKVRETKDG